ncbi:MAG: CHASE2 domain-containing protein [Phormidesmis sp.]
MNKRIVIKIGAGSIETGYAAAVQIGDEGIAPQAETQAYLPPAPDLPGLYQRWQQSYLRLGLPTRLEAQDGITNVSNLSQMEHCRRLSRELRDRVHSWLDGNEFRPIREKILEQLNPHDQARILLQTQDPLLQRLPWYELQFFDRYRQAEVGICALDYQQVSQPISRIKPVRILAVFGDATGLNTQVDQALLSNILDADISALNQPSREDFNQCLWDEGGWDILFFAGHSSSRSQCEPNDDTNSEAGSGEIALNPTDKLTIPQLKHALKKAIDRGLNTAIFNSCDGLGLATDLASLHIPQVLVMREPVPDQVAHAFLQGFLESFAAGNSFYLSVREAREKLQGLEAKFPCATWLPVIVQNLAETPPTWRSLQGKPENSLISNHSVLPKAVQIPHRHRWKTGLSAGIITATILLFIRQFGGLEQWDLGAYDQLMRSKPTENVDNRLLIITNTDADVAKRPDPSGRSLTDATLLALLNKLKPLSPQIIGLDIYRDFAATDPALASQLKTTHNLIAVCKAEDSTTTPPTLAEAPPPEISTHQRLGNTDFAYGNEPAGVLRRHLLFMQGNPPCNVKTTFSTLIAMRYLAEGHSVSLGNDYNPADGLKMGSAVWPVILKQQTAFGGYHDLDTQGYQILLNYRRLRDSSQQTKCGAIETPADCLTVEEVLSLPLEELRGYIQGRIVLIGTTATRFNEDRWITPFTRTRLIEDQTPGLFLQAQMISQLISAELDQPPRPLYAAWPKWKEVAWIVSWASLGGLLGAYAVRNARAGPLKLWLWLLMGEGIMLFVCWLWLIQAGIWVPWVPSALAFPTAALAAQATLSFQYRSPKDLQSI